MNIFSTNGFAFHKRLFRLLFIVWLSLLVGSLVGRLYELSYSKQMMLSLLPFSLFAIVTVYLTYVVKRTNIRIELSEKGITYEKGIGNGWRFRRIRSFVPWEAVKEVTIHDRRKGPLIIHTTQEDLLYWNVLVLNENEEVAQAIRNRIKRID